MEPVFSSILSLCLFFWELKIIDIELYQCPIIIGSHYFVYDDIGGDDGRGSSSGVGGGVCVFLFVCVFFF